MATRCVLFVSLLCAICVVGKQINGSVCYDSSTQSFTFLPGVLDSSCPAHGVADDQHLTTGWYMLRSVENSAVAWEHDWISPTAVGYLEASLLSTALEDSLTNLDNLFHFLSDPAVATWINDNLVWMQGQVQKNPGDEFWVEIGRQLSYVRGVSLGTQGKRNFTEILMVNTGGDLMDIATALHPSNTMDQPHVHPLLRSLPASLFRPHCTGMVRSMPDQRKLCHAHATWGMYSMLTRVYKVTERDFGPGIGKYVVTQSGYPGVMASLDDFLTVTHYGPAPSYTPTLRMSVVETTLDVYDTTLYKQLKPQTLLTWTRSAACTRLAHSAEHWTKLFEQHNSGTYNNQWMVLQPDEGVLWVTEQAPNKVISFDASSMLKRSGEEFFPSYNIPMNRTIWTYLGYEAKWNETHDERYSYTHAARAQLFARDGKHNTTTSAAVDQFMRSNSYCSDPISQGDPRNAISGRYDLLKDSPMTLGGYDAKVICYDLDSAAQRLRIVCGPTATPCCPTFEWANWAQFPHQGMPAKYDFDWVDVQL